MDIKEYKAAIRERPFLALDLFALYRKGNLEKATLYRPGEADEKYNNFCDKLNLKNKPYLLVVDDDAKKFKDEDGIYRAASNMVAVPRSIFEKFQEGNTRGEFVVGHELGHAKFAQQQSRRKFLGHGGAFLGGLAAGQLTRAAGNAILETDVPKEKGTLSHAQKAKKDEKPKREISVPGVLIREAATISATWFSATKIYNLLTRAEEFQADQYAKELVPAREIIASMTTTLEGLIANKEQLNTLKTAFDSAVAKREEELGYTIDATGKERAWATVLAESTLPKMTLKEIVTSNYYPKFQESLLHMARSETPKSR